MVSRIWIFIRLLSLSTLILIQVPKFAFIEFLKSWATFANSHDEGVCCQLSQFDLNQCLTRRAVHISLNCRVDSMLDGVF